MCKWDREVLRAVLFFKKMIVLCFSWLQLHPITVCLGAFQRSIHLFSQVFTPAVRTLPRWTNIMCEQRNCGYERQHNWYDLVNLFFPYPVLLACIQAKYQTALWNMLLKAHNNPRSLGTRTLETVRRKQILASVLTADLGEEASTVQGKAVITCTAHNQSFNV